MIKKLLYSLFCLLALSACKIENDIPYPIVDGSIEAFETEGQCDAEGNSSNQTTINKSERTISLYVDDTVDLTALRITKLTVTNDATLNIDSTLCHNYAKFPTTGFGSTDDLITSADTRVDFSEPVTLILSTYQDYLWKITVQQIIKREIILENQIGNAVIDEINRNVIVYVNEDQPLDRIKATSFKLGGTSGKVFPDPTASDTYDFSQPVTFYVQNGWEETSLEWTVYVYHSDGETETSGDTFVRATSASLSGSIQSGKRPSITYKKADATDWMTQPDADIAVNGTSFSTTLTGLTPGTSYQYSIQVDGTDKGSGSFTTAPATPLTNGSFDDWSSSPASNGTLWQPWASGGESFWDTGNKGATTIADSNTTPTSETCNGSGQAASLATEWRVLKLAAGNIFTGSYVRTDGTNGVLSFGREFSSFPTKLRVHYKYTSVPIDKIGEDALQALKGKSDSCHIYIALTDWDQPLEIRTRPSERQLFDKNDSHVIAYAEYISGNSDSEYQQRDLVLDYRYTNRTPKYILVVASASKYGDYFTGGVGSKLLIDNFELIYD